MGTGAPVTTRGFRRPDAGVRFFETRRTDEPTKGPFRTTTNSRPNFEISTKISAQRLNARQR